MARISPIEMAKSAARLCAPARYNAVFPHGDAGDPIVNFTLGRLCRVHIP